MKSAALGAQVLVGFALAGTSQVQAAPSSRPNPTTPPVAAPIVASAPLEEFVRLDATKLTIDCADLGGPGFVGEFVSSDEAGLEMESNVPMMVSYASAFGLRTGAGELPTWIQIAAQGAGESGGIAFTSPGDFTVYGALPAYQLGDSAGWTSFHRYALSSPTAPNSLKKGFKVRLVALRNGLADAGGQYNAQILLTWSRL